MAMEKSSLKGKEDTKNPSKPILFLRHEESIIIHSIEICDVVKFIITECYNSIDVLLEFIYL